MKKGIIISSVAYAYVLNAYAAEINGQGMKGYNVYVDGQGNKVIQHPTVPTISFNSNGEKVSSPPKAELKQIGTVASDGSITPIGDHGSGLITAGGWAIMIAFVVAIVGMIWKAKRGLTIKMVEQEALNRMKANIASEANGIFTRFNKNFRPSQIDYISENSTENFFNSVKDNIVTESDFKEITFKSVKSEVDTVIRENEQFIASVRFTALKEVAVDNEVKEAQTVELWKMNFNGTKWIVSEIKELAPMIERKLEKSTVLKEEVEQEQQAQGGGKYGI